MRIRNARAGAQWRHSRWLFLFGFLGCKPVGGMRGVGVGTFDKTKEAERWPETCWAGEY